MDVLSAEASMPPPICYPILVLSLVCIGLCTAACYTQVRVPFRFPRALLPFNRLLSLVELVYQAETRKFVSDCSQHRRHTTTRLVLVNNLIARRWKYTENREQGEPSQKHLPTYVSQATIYSEIEQKMSAKVCVCVCGTACRAHRRRKGRKTFSFDSIHAWIGKQNTKEQQKAKRIEYNSCKYGRLSSVHLPHPLLSVYCCWIARPELRRRTQCRNKGTRAEQSARHHSINSTVKIAVLCTILCVAPHRGIVVLIRVWRRRRHVNTTVSKRQKVFTSSFFSRIL